MHTRMELSAILKAICPNVYFSPPSTIKMNYPAIVYSRDDMPTSHADNTPYRISYLYRITVIDSNPDSSIVEAVKKIPTCSYDRHYTESNLNHDIFTLYY